MPDSTHTPGDASAMPTPLDHSAHAGAASAAPEAGAAHGTAAAQHGGEGGHGSRVPELENFWNLLAESPLNREGAPLQPLIRQFDPFEKPGNDAAAVRLHTTNQSVFFSLLAAAAVILLFRRALRKRAMIPDRAQSAAEMLIDGLRTFFISILGEKHGPRYIPFLLGLFFFILANNLMGLVPLMKPSTNAFQCNIVLGLCVFCYVQYTGLRRSGPKKYLLHLMGNPQGLVMWLMSPILLLLELIAEIVKPISLSLRLFGNILGEDILLGVFVSLGILVTAGLLRPLGIEHPYVGIPLHLPFLFLATLTSVIQALIFSLLSCVYILLMLPHEAEGH